jgi:hypothetical protein
MKLFLLSLVMFLAFSCTPKDDPKSNELGEEREIGPVVVQDGTGLKIALMEACGVLAEKERNLDDYVGRENFSFSYQESECGGTRSTGANLIVQVKRVNSNYEFFDVAGEFRMPEVETHKSGIMKEICESLVGIKNPLITGQTAIEMRTVTTSNCRNDRSNVCLQIMRGRISADGMTYKVGESTLMNIQLYGNNVGFYTYKSVKTFGACPSGKFKTKTATLL